LAPARASLICPFHFQPNNEKALYRKAKCLEERGQVEEAIGILRRITRLYPDNKSSKADLARYLHRDQ
jgi:tetratricopeptide (TPR) repeat protein